MGVKLQRQLWMGELTALGVSVLVSAAVWVLPAYSDELSDVRLGSGGLHLAPFWVQPTVEAGVFYDSLPDATAGYIAANVEAKSDFNRHALNFGASAQRYEYFDSDADEHTNLFGYAENRIDVLHDLTITSGVRGGLFEDSGAADSTTCCSGCSILSPGAACLTDISSAPNAAEPVPYSTADAWSIIRKDFNHIAVTADALYSISDYHDVAMIGGGTLDQDFRDGTQYEVGGRLDYIFSPAYSVFARTSYNQRDYDNGDSHGWRGLGGLAFELTSLLRGDIGVGYFTQMYDTGTDVSGFSYHVGVVWNPTMLMTVRVNGDRMVDESDIADSPGSVVSRIEAAIDYEVLRTVIVTPRFGYALNDYVDSPLDSQSVWGSVDAQYYMNDFLSFGFNYTVEKVDYSGVGTDY